MDIYYCEECNKIKLRLIYSKLYLAKQISCKNKITLNKN